MASKVSGQSNPNLRMQIANPTTIPQTTMPHPPNTASDDPSTKHSKSSVRKLN
jgi:hypothetical protein